MSSSLPDLVLSLARDGRILGLNPGSLTALLNPAHPVLGLNVTEIWPREVADVVSRLVRKSIAGRAVAEASFDYRGEHFEARASAMGPDRATCVIRPGAEASADSLDATAARLGPQIDRRGFLRRFKETAALALLRETPLAVAMLHIEGLADIAQAIAPKVSEQILTAAVARLLMLGSDTQAPPRSWYLGQLSDTLLALVIESGDLPTIESWVEHVCASFGAPVELAGDSYHLTASAGIAILGQDAASARGVLDHARTAMNEARRDGGGGIRFFTDSLGSRSLARLDIARELQSATAERQVTLRYSGRHDLRSGELLAVVGSLRWQHPLRGEIRPADFLRIAEATGQGAALSRAALGWLQDDYTHLPRPWNPRVRISFAALRHHLADERFVADVEQLLAAGTIAAPLLELRIAAAHLPVRSPGDLRALTEAGVRLVIEAGRDTLALDWLARADVYGLQLDRALVLEARRNTSALKLCKAQIAVARALELVPICAGIDAQPQRQMMLELGCQAGSGDLYRSGGVAPLEQFDTTVI